jgi:4'-phosphopantetheinyl transferase
MQKSVDIWYFKTNKDFRIKLHPKEIEKGLSFYQSIHQHRYLTTRSIIKDILNRYLMLPASDLWQFSENSYGKPYLAEHPNFYFNWSHCQDDGLLMISRHGPVGIDLEHQRRVEYLEIAKKLYSKEENDFLQQLDPSKLPQYFFHIWVQKEAFIKAIGMGLSFPTQTFTSILYQEQGKIHRQNQDWQLTHFMVKPHCHAAFCHKIDELKIQWLTH